jgi:cysteinyl-tRNA synthetase
MRLYDTLTSQKRDFQPLGDEVRLYVCGVTPYSAAHVGHAMSYVAFDTLGRYLAFSGYRVRHVQNFTDIDDKIIAASHREGIPAEALAARYIQDYLEEMDRLNILRADAYPLATEEVPGIIEMIAGLIERGFAYPAEGDVYYRVTRFPGYGKLSRRSLDGMMAGARVEPVAAKEHPMDFALWKAAKPEEPSWESPWGPGRPGWHIECSAMCLKYLGERVDIHGGGLDLVFPHHENEIAQSEAFTGQAPFVGFWLHNGLLQMDESKMSKSLGNLVTVSEALSLFSADAIRLFFLGSHYRSPLAYSDEGVRAQERAVERLRLAATAPEASDAHGDGVDAASLRERFVASLDDDLNTPKALAALFDLAREINRGREDSRPVAEAQATLRELAGVLGLTLAAPDSADGLTGPLVEVLAEVRSELRAARQFDLADRIRSRLQGLGVLLEDSAQGTTWRLQR